MDRFINLAEIRDLAADMDLQQRTDLRRFITVLRLAYCAEECIQDGDAPNICAAKCGENVAKPPWFFLSG